MYSSDKSAFKELLVIPVCSTGHAVAHLVQVGAIKQKDSGSIPDLVIGIFH